MRRDDLSGGDFKRRTLVAGELGDVDVQYVWRFLRSHKIDLVARKSWCESNDPNFTAKAADVVGLYVAPPERAIVLCVNECPSIQAELSPNFGDGRAGQAAAVMG